MGLREKLAIVTGGASGLGRAIVERFAAEGAHVVIADVNEALGAALAAQLGATTLFRKLDVASEDDWAETLDVARSMFGPLYCLVNNAGVSKAGSIADTSLSAWQQTLDVNATGTFLGCRTAVGAMRDLGGVIINVASARGQRPSGGQVAYCASKSLVITLTESVAISCGEQGLDIRCNAICPGVFDTPLLAEVQSHLGGKEKADIALSRLHLAGRLGRPDELAAMAAFLASDEARFITGACFNVDGGFRIRDR